MASSSSRHQPRHAVGTYSTRSLPPELEESEEATAVWAAARAASSSTRLTLIDGWRIEWRPRLGGGSSAGHQKRGDLYIFQPPAELGSGLGPLGSRPIRSLAALQDVLLLRHEAKNNDGKMWSPPLRGTLVEVWIDSGRDATIAVDDGGEARAGVAGELGGELVREARPAALEDAEQDAAPHHARAARKRTARDARTDPTARAVDAMGERGHGVASGDGEGGDARGQHDAEADGRSALGEAGEEPSDAEVDADGGEANGEAGGDGEGDGDESGWRRAEVRRVDTALGGSFLVVVHDLDGTPDESET